LATSRVLATAVKYLGGCDLLLFGHQSSDGDTAQVPCQTAEILGLNSITHVNTITVNENLLTIEQEMHEMNTIEVHFLW